MYLNIMLKYSLGVKESSKGKIEEQYSEVENQKVKWQAQTSNCINNINCEEFPSWLSGQQTQLASGSIPGLALCVNDPALPQAVVQVTRHYSDPTLHRPAAIAPIGPLDWVRPYAAGAVLKRQKDQKKKLNMNRLNNSIKKAEIGRRDF